VLVKARKKVIKFEKVSPLIVADWRVPGKNYGKRNNALYIGTYGHMKDAVRIAAQRLSKMEGRKVSMSEVGRRLLAAAGLI
jgi:3-mercaptopyruvate sulfurtransferase SseA